MFCFNSHFHEIHCALQVLSDVLRLSVPPADKKLLRNKKEWTYYDHEKLTDLQSKLMLVAGKAESGNKEVERFVQVNNVQQISSESRKVMFVKRTFKNIGHETCCFYRMMS